jgi:hypothetical protein
MTGYLPGFGLSMAALLSVPAYADTRTGQFAVEGSGGATCAQYNAARTSGSKEFGRMFGFIEGYLTAANRYEQNTYDLSPWQDGPAFALMIAKNCAKTPRERLVTTVQRLVVSLQPTRLTEPSQRVPIAARADSPRIYASVVQRAQRALKQKGLYQGPDDGRLTPALKTALLQFQRSSKLQPTGDPDVATLWMLFNP